MGGRFYEISLVAYSRTLLTTPVATMEATVRAKLNTSKMVGIQVAREQRSVSLFDLIDNIVRSSLPFALRNHNLILNEISSGFNVHCDKDSLTGIVRGVLDAIMEFSKSSYIRISARRYHEIVLIHFKDFNILNKTQAPYNLQPVQELASKIDGYIGITSFRQYESTIALSFADKG